MKKKSVELININEAKSLLNSGGLNHLADIIYKNKTVNVGNKTYITKRQFENCLKKEDPGSVKAVNYNFVSINM